MFALVSYDLPNEKSKHTEFKSYLEDKLSYNTVPNISTTVWKKFSLSMASAVIMAVEEDLRKAKSHCAVSQVVAEVMASDDISESLKI
jgi:Cdc6-like AAA superfamily ATPase